MPKTILPKVNDAERALMEKLLERRDLKHKHAVRVQVEILRQHKLKPNLIKRFRISPDPQFKEKLADIVGLYLDPPEKAIVLSIDEKSQIQALERMQPILALRPGLPERQTHDYYRHGTTTLFAVLDVAGGRVMGACKARHRASDYIEFLRLVDKKSPKGMKLHLIVDNVSSHKTKEVREYLASIEGRFEVHQRLEQRGKEAGMDQELRTNSAEHEKSSAELNRIIFTGH